MNLLSCPAAKTEHSESQDKGRLYIESAQERIIHKLLGGVDVYARHKQMEIRQV